VQAPNSGRSSRSIRARWAAAAVFAVLACAPVPSAVSDEATGGDSSEESRREGAPAAVRAAPARTDAMPFDAARARALASAPDRGDAIASLSAALEAAGFAVRSLAAGGPDGRTSHSLVARRAGSSPDALLLIAPIPDRRGTNTAAAIAVEAARALALSPRAYGTLVALIDAGSLGDAVDPLAAAARDARAMHAAGELAGVRAGVYLDGVCGEPPRIVRDLSSHRVHRELVWRKAREIGFGSAFDRDSFDAPLAGKQEFAALGVRGLVALVDAEEAGSNGAGCSLAGVEPVGETVVASLLAIEEQLARIDVHAAAAAATTTRDPRERRAASLPDAKGDGS